MFGSEPRCCGDGEAWFGEGYETLDEMVDCCEDFEEPPPNTLLKKPGLSLGVAFGVDGEGNIGLRMATVGDGAGGS